MTCKVERQIAPLDLRPGQDRFREEVLDGLQKPQKELPCKYFYDDRGSRLFERICTLDEYYVPHLETAIMLGNVEEMAAALGRNVVLIEYGSGNSAKTRILLDHLRQPAAYVPVDFAREQLIRATGELIAIYPQLKVFPVCADYTDRFHLPALSGQRKVVYFPGSTIGNLCPAEAVSFLHRIASVCGPGGGLLIGVDLKKDPAVLHRAYNDPQGVTAAFNLNVLHRINRELNSGFRPDWFEHYAFYNPLEGRVEMHLVSLRDHIVWLDEVPIAFARGESIWTESSYKYNIDQFAGVARAAGFEVERVWTDERRWFSVQYLVNKDDATSLSLLDEMRAGLPDEGSAASFAG